MSKSKFKTQTIDQIMHANIMEQIEKQTKEAERQLLENEQRQFERQQILQQQRFEHEKEMSGLVNPIDYLDKVVSQANITSTIRKVGDKKEILISIVLG